MTAPGEGRRSPADVFEELKKFVAFTATDADNLKSLGPILAKYQGGITDDFYAVLARFTDTAKMIDGRVERLKQTHARWFEALFGGEYGQAYFEDRWRIGMAHVRIGLDPFWVEGVMDVIRTQALQALCEECANPKRIGEQYASLVKILDLDLAIINLSYQEERLDRLTGFTGMKRSLIENIIRIPRKA